MQRPAAQAAWAEPLVPNHPRWSGGAEKRAGSSSNLRKCWVRPRACGNVGQEKE